ncbi:MAG: glycosyltransferase family 4 protein [Bacteroidia bacterium]|nr:glycosyltransferase family 4 protein [Bacteroidia bacterium]
MDIIHILLGKANPNRMNGVNKVVLELATEQKKHGHHVQIWGLTKSPINLTDNRSTVPTLLFKHKQNPFALSSYLQLAIKRTPSNAVFHIHGGWIPVYWQLVRHIKKNGNRVILTPHGSYNRIAMLKNRWVKKIYFKMFEIDVLKRVDHIHCLGASEALGLEAIFPNQKHTVLPYGVYRNPIQHLPQPSDKFILGFVGRLTAHTKGLDLVIKAFEQFSRKKHVELWIVGDGQDKEHLERLTKEIGVASKVVFLGKLFGEDKRAVMRQMTAFVHPSRNEGLPTAVLEASSMGIPCIVSDATNLAGYISQYRAGVRVSNENLVELILGMAQIYKHWLINKIGAYRVNAERMIAQEFAWSTIVPKYTQLYQSI